MGNENVKNENLNSELVDMEGKESLGNIGNIELRGLANIGNSSFINSTIQCLSNCKEFAKMFISAKNTFVLESNPLLQRLSKIILYLYNKNPLDDVKYLFNKLIFLTVRRIENGQKST